MKEDFPMRPSGGTMPSARVHHRFEAQAACAPDTCAVTMAGETALTYRELDRLADRFARHLCELGVGPEVIVGVCLERSLGGIIGVLAILKAGGAYLPLDPAYPAERLAYMLANARAGLLITEADVWPADSPPGCRQISWREYAAAMDATSGMDDGPCADPAEAGGDPLCYVIYTSGSTGRPKGVAMPHGPLCHLLDWQARACPLAAGARVLQFSPLSFDVSFQEIFSTLGAGGTLVLVPEAMRRDPRALLRFLADQNISRVFLPPVMLAQLADQHAAGAARPRGLREIITAGEALRVNPAVAGFFAALRAGNGGGALHNHYGPTETHVATAYTLPGEPETWPALPSIGRPIDGTQIRLLDEVGQPVAPGQPGALYLGGSCVARGYLHEPELTAARFVNFDGTRWYQTGDLAQVQPDGNLQFLGRADDQIKLRGFRVELGEIEAMLARHPAVRETAVGVAPGVAGGGPELVACFVPREAAASPPAAAELRTWLLDRLPDYLVPARFAVIDRLPLTPSGKVDRRALPLDRADRAESTDRLAAPAPQAPLEKLIARLWEETLGLRCPGVRENFFEAGGNSLLAMQVHSKLCQALGREFPITALFQHPTIAALAAHLGTDRPAAAAGAAASVQDRARRQQQHQQQNPQAAAARARLAATASARRPG